ncbi:hypothetical protein L1987_15866 [Smallanthus sonchifolius]|uniref:Uncharacterized protein n=1 Tax=Smallanthus sonchifolius TaxID=185202 RepID=A0ACB9J8W1_9ASTR|nr:hypothetical protein L1987_15866 [Smallanthus sonchifolius]
MPKLLSLIAQFNVNPRLGDKVKVRHDEIRVLHALLTRGLKFSFRHMVMMNVCESRESLDRKMIPHYRLITALMRMQGALHQNIFYMVKHHKLIVLGNLSYQEWSYNKTDRRFISKDKNMKQRIEGLLDNVQPLEGEDEGDEGNDGEEEEVESEDDAKEGDGGARERVFEDDLLEAIVRLLDLRSTRGG